VRVGVVAVVAVVVVVVAVVEVVVPTESASVPWRVGRTRSRHRALATAGYLPSHPTSPSRFLCTLWWRLWLVLANSVVARVVGLSPARLRLHVLFGVCVIRVRVCMNAYVYVCACVYVPVPVCPCVCVSVSTSRIPAPPD
jgi:hypothetical protein